MEDKEHSEHDHERMQDSHGVPIDPHGATNGFNLNAVLETLRHRIPQHRHEGIDEYEKRLLHLAYLQQEEYQRTHPEPSVKELDEQRRARELSLHEALLAERAEMEPEKPMSKEEIAKKAEQFRSKRNGRVV